MTLDEFTEVKMVVATMMQALSPTSAGSVGIVSANLHYGIADILANADALVRTNSIAAPLANVFDLATAAGATIADFEAVRTTLLSLTLITPIAIAVCQYGIQFVLAQEVAIYAATTFTSRQQVALAIAQLTEAFDSAIEYAADNKDPASYQALMAASGAIIRHLADTQRPLAKMITYTVGRVMTSLTLANYLYGDASRADQLSAENQVVSPQFMPPSGIALSA